MFISKFQSKETDCKSEHSTGHLTSLDKSTLLIVRYCGLEVSLCLLLAGFNNTEELSLHLVISSGGIHTHDYIEHFSFKDLFQMV